MITWETLNDVLKFMLYVSGVVLIVAAPIVLILALIRTPLDHTLKAWADYKLRVIDNAMRATERIKLDDGTIIIKRFMNGAIDYETIHEPHVPNAIDPSEDQQTQPSGAAISSARWIVESYATTQCKNEKHKHGPSGNQLLTQDECIASGVFGSPRDWQAARDWMRDQWLVTERSGTSNPGTFTDKPLSEMLSVLTALPQRKT